MNENEVPNYYFDISALISNQTLSELSETGPNMAQPLVLTNLVFSHLL